MALDAHSSEPRESAALVAHLRAALRESEERFQKTFRVCPDAITVTDMATSRYVDVNGAFEVLFGYSREEVIGHPALDFGIWAHPKDREDLVFRLRQDGRVKAFHAVGRRKDGALLTCEIHAEQVEVAGRRDLILVVRDITEQLRTERALHEALARFSKAFWASPDAMVIMDLEDERLVEVNEGFALLYGRDSSQIVGRTSASLGMHVDGGQRGHYLERLRAEGRLREEPLSFCTADGAVRELLMSAEVMEVSGRLHAVVDLRDVTEQRRLEAERRSLEAQLRQAQKLEALGSLAGGIAHDFNNILTAILSYSELALMDLEGDGELRTCLNEVRRAGERARDLVRQILSFSRVNREEQKVQCLGPVVAEAVRLLRSSLPATVRIEEEGLEDETLVVRANATQLHQVVMNLGTNAVQAMADGRGLLSVRLRRADVARSRGAPLQPGNVCIEVFDTGCGMPPEVKARIFEPFYTTKAAGVGTGLGLAVVFGIVQSHNGLIEVESEEGRGTCFRITLPLDPGEVLAEAREDRVLPRGRGESVLFIDDEPSLCQFAKMLLTKLGYRVTTCTNPLAVLEMLVPERFDYDLVVTDLTMPHFTGLDLTRRVRDAGLKAPVILCSGLPLQWTRSHLDELGLAGVLPKPLTAFSLTWELRRVLDAQPGPGD